MTPGPNRILKLPRTGNLTKVSTIMSGNTIGARWWTDGKMEAPMMPDNPWFRRDPHTGETFWCDECEKVASEDPWRGDTEYADIPFAVEAKEEDLKAELSSNVLSGDKERYLRTRLWWLWNDVARNGNNDHPRPTAFQENLRRLIHLLDYEQDNSRLIAAECLRELGDHKEAARLLDHEFPEGFRSSVEVIRKANDHRDVDLREIT